ncbi:protein-L-isoaspartate(D-aspartate) O-methyltransferase [Undibacter mobilis]|uniref:Protein-L-isoaspartate O-methyltransferase n=1 Tax=Undibacter mobilis TaxID=2292256 RepID=A0A371B0I9_9BRAD|nr:protein-L-isoaspartate(D-aspartate) O-methyltransferase [Undibacter mobilis]RDV01086.1 protein-L-isoaspartate(D-aspartate) O-methyltransferase [Undibacter mobilis]
MTDETANQADIDRVNFLLTLRRRGISDQAVLRAMGEVSRTAFVSPDTIASAYADQALPIECGQTISQPYVVGYMTEQLGLKPHHRVLEIGTGSGYQAAILAKLAREVVSIERYRTLADQARRRLGAEGAANVEVIVGDGFEGCPDRAPFDRIIVTAAAEEVPEALAEQLADGGVMIMPLGPENGPQHLVKLTKSQTPEGVRLGQEKLIPVRFVPMLRGKAREL